MPNVAVSTSRSQLVSGLEAILGSIVEVSSSHSRSKDGSVGRLMVSSSVDFVCRSRGITVAGVCMGVIFVGCDFICSRRIDT